MNKLFISTAVAAVLATSQSFAYESKFTQDCKPFGSGSAVAYESKEAAISEKVGPVLEKAQQMLQAGKHSDAATELNAVVAGAKRVSDGTLANYLLSFAYYGMHQHDRAEAAIREALKNPQLLTAEQQQQAQQNLVQIKLSTGRYAEALTAIQDYFRAGGAQRADMYVLAASAYAQINKPREAICAADVGLSKGGSSKALYDLLISAHWSLNDFADLPGIFDEALQKNPGESRYYTQMAMVQLHLKNEAAALAAYEKANEKGVLSKESDITNLASLYEKSGNKPEKAAVLIEEAIKSGKLKATEKNWKFAAGYWTRANKNDKTIAAYAEAGKLVEHGEYDLYQGQIYADMHKWVDSANAFKAAVAKGKLKDEGNAWLNLGIAQYRAAQINESKASLKKSATFESSKKEALKMMKTVEAVVQ